MRARIITSCVIMMRSAHTYTRALKERFFRHRYQKNIIKICSFANKKHTFIVKCITWNMY